MAQATKDNTAIPQRVFVEIWLSKRTHFSRKPRHLRRGEFETSAGHGASVLAHHVPLSTLRASSDTRS